jgi:transcriptional regulator with XRE-family HTH domain
MYYRNFIFLVNKTGKTQKLVSQELHFTESSIWQWRHGRKPNKNNLKRISEYFSQQLNIPYSLFEDGQALLTKDFEKILAKQKGIGYIEEAKPTHQGTPGRGETRVTKEEITRRSARYDKFIQQLIYLYNKQKGLEDSALFQDIPETSLNQILDGMIEFIAAIEFDVELMSSLSRGLSRLGRHKKNANTKYPEGTENVEILPESDETS